MSNASKLVGTFVGVLVLVLAVAAAGPLLTATTPSDERTATNASSFDPDSNLVEEPAEDGNITLDTNASEKVIVVDRAHRNDVSQSKLQPFVQSLVAAGHEVRFYGSGERTQRAPPINDTLANADAFVISAPRSGYDQSEIRGVVNFSERGGRVLMLAEPSSTRIAGGGLFSLEVEQVTTDLTALSSRYGITTGTGYLFNMHENANNFQHVYATPANDTNLTDNVDRGVFKRGTPVTTHDENATAILEATEQTRLSTTRSEETYAVGAQTGNVTVIGDSSFLAPSTHRDADNEALVSNVAEFLVSGNKTEPPMPDEENGTGPGGFGSGSGGFGGGDSPPAPPSRP